MAHRPTVTVLALSLLMTQGMLSPLLAQGGLTSRRTVAPGVTHSEYSLPGPFTLDVLEITLGDPYLRFESYRPSGLTRTTAQAAANDHEGHRVVGAVSNVALPRS